MSKAKKMTLEKEAISNIKEDRLVLRKFIRSASSQLTNKDGSEAKELHKELGEIFSKYIQASVKNNEQLVEILKLQEKRKVRGDEDEEITDDDIESIYDAIEDDTSEGNSE